MTHLRRKNLLSSYQPNKLTDNNTNIISTNNPILLKLKPYTNKILICFALIAYLFLSIVVYHQFTNPDQQNSNQIISKAREKIEKYNLLTNDQLLAELQSTEIGIQFQTQTQTQNAEKMQQPMISYSECMNILTTEYPDLGRLRRMRSSFLRQLVFVTHAKTGSTYFSDILEAMTSHHLITDKDDIFEHQNMIDVSELQLANHFCNESVLKISIVRDPMSRLLSGFLDKCTNFELDAWYHIHCREFFKFMDIQMEHVQNPTLQNVEWTMQKIHKFGNQAMYPESETKLLEYQALFGSFLEWLIDNFSDYKTRVDAHYNHMIYKGYLKDFHTNYHIFDMHNPWIWYLVGRIVIDSDNNNQQLQYWNSLFERLQFRNSVSIKSVAEHFHFTHADNKIAVYFGSNMYIIYLAMKWSYIDYWTFDIPIPEWICDSINTQYNDNDHQSLEDSSTNNVLGIRNRDVSNSVHQEWSLKLKQLLNEKFNQKLYLLPDCIKL